MVRKAKPTKMSPAAARELRLRVSGGEPEVHGKIIGELEHIQILNWYSGNKDQKDAKAYLMAYLADSGHRDEAEGIARVHDKWVPATAAWNARMLTRGAVLPIRSVNLIMQRVRDAISRDQPVDEEEGAEKVEEPSAPVKVRPKRTEAIIAEIEEIIDDFREGEVNDFQAYTWLTDRGINASAAKELVRFYEPVALELKDAMAGGEAAEGYKSLTKAELRRRTNFYNDLVEDAGKLVQNVKRIRKARAKKAPTMERRLKNLRYMENCPELKMVSVNPESMLRAKEAWVYNVKYHTLTVYRAKTTDGLGLHRSSPTDYDEATSKTWCLGSRKGPQVGPELQNMNRRTFEKMMNTATWRSHEPSGRINEHCIILRVEK